ncbi:hypothetical protein ID866_6930 [Astraeus odoratus]|nr:hypothetical protein ID866_6930 [Astraeus odoratus]
MATFEYVDIPPEAIRLESSPQDMLTHAVRPAHKTLTSFPDPSTASSPSWRIHLDPLVAGNTTTPLSQTKNALSMVPQFLLSSSLPSSVTSSTSGTPSSTTPSLFSGISSPRSPQSTHALLSSRDPLSLPTITTNFRRFVAKVGPIFWLQDRIEEVILWKKDWKRTAVWLAAYGFICYFPRLILLLPHMLLLGVMLAYHPQPGSPPAPASANEGTVDWQANIQAIQNLMGAFSDAHDMVLPLLPLLVPLGTSQPATSSTANPPSTSVQPPKPVPKSASPTSSTLPTLQKATSSISTAHTSYKTDGEPNTSLKLESDPDSNVLPPLAQPHPALLMTLVSFLVLLPVVMFDILPLRLLFFLAGAGSVCALHPKVWSTLVKAWKARAALSASNISFTVSIPIPTVHRLYLPLACCNAVKRASCASPNEKRYFHCRITEKKARSAVRRLIDNDRLSDKAWSAPMCTVELWENERWEPMTSGASGTGGRTSLLGGSGVGVFSGNAVTNSGANGDSEGDEAKAEGSAKLKSKMQSSGTWGKAYLRSSERAPWTRGRDGWSGVGGEVRWVSCMYPSFYVLYFSLLCLDGSFVGNFF